MSQQLAQLYFTDDELEVLAGLVETEIRRLEELLVPREWSTYCGKLNSLRTALREAQYTLRIPQP